VAGIDVVHFSDFARAGLTQLQLRPTGYLSTSFLVLFGTTLAALLWGQLKGETREFIEHLSIFHFLMMFEPFVLHSISRLTSDLWLIILVFHVVAGLVFRSRLSTIGALRNIYQHDSLKNMGWLLLHGVALGALPLLIWSAPGTTELSMRMLPVACLLLITGIGLQSPLWGLSGLALATGAVHVLGWEWITQEQQALWSFTWPFWALLELALTYFLGLLVRHRSEFLQPALPTFPLATARSLLLGLSWILGLVGLGLNSVISLKNLSVLSWSSSSPDGLWMTLTMCLAWIIHSLMFALVGPPKWGEGYVALCVSCAGLIASCAVCGGLVSLSLVLALKWTVLAWLWSRVAQATADESRQHCRHRLSRILSSAGAFATLGLYLPLTWAGAIWVRLACASALQVCHLRSTASHPSRWRNFWQYLSLLGLGGAVICLSRSGILVFVHAPGPILEGGILSILLLLLCRSAGVLTRFCNDSPFLTQIWNASVPHHLQELCRGLAAGLVSATVVLQVLVNLTDLALPGTSAISNSLVLVGGALLCALLLPGPRSQTLSWLWLAMAQLALLGLTVDGMEVLGLASGKSFATHPITAYVFLAGLAFISLAVRDPASSMFNLIHTQVPESARKLWYILVSGTFTVSLLEGLAYSGTNPPSQALRIAALYPVALLLGTGVGSKAGRRVSGWLHTSLATLILGSHLVLAHRLLLQPKDIAIDCAIPLIAFFVSLVFWTGTRLTTSTPLGRIYPKNVLLPWLDGWALLSGILCLLHSVSFTFCRHGGARIELLATCVIGPLLLLLALRWLVPRLRQDFLIIVGLFSLALSLADTGLGCTPVLPMVTLWCLKGLLVAIQMSIMAAATRTLLSLHPHPHPLSMRVYGWTISVAMACVPTFSIGCFFSQVAQGQTSSSLTLALMLIQLPSLWWQRKTNTPTWYGLACQHWALFLLTASMALITGVFESNADLVCQLPLFGSILAVFSLLTLPANSSPKTLARVLRRVQGLEQFCFDPSVLHLWSKIFIYAAGILTLATLGSLVDPSLAGGTSLVITVVVHLAGLFLTRSRVFQVSTLLLPPVLGVWSLRVAFDEYLVLLEWPILSFVLILLAHLYLRLATSMSHDSSEETEGSPALPWGLSALESVGYGVLHLGGVLLLGCLYEASELDGVNSVRILIAAGLSWVTLCVRSSQLLSWLALILTQTGALHGLMTTVKQWGDVDGLFDLPLMAYGFLLGLGVIAHGLRNPSSWLARHVPPETLNQSRPLWSFAVIVTALLPLWSFLPGSSAAFDGSLVVLSLYPLALLMGQGFGCSPRQKALAWLHTSLALLVLGFHLALLNWVGSLGSIGPFVTGPWLSLFELTLVVVLWLLARLTSQGRVYPETVTRLWRDGWAFVASGLVILPSRVILLGIGGDKDPLIPLLVPILAILAIRWLVPTLAQDLMVILGITLLVGTGATSGITLPIAWQSTFPLSTALPLVALEGLILVVAVRYFFALHPHPNQSSDNLYRNIISFILLAIPPLTIISTLGLLMGEAPLFTAVIPLFLMIPPSLWWIKFLMVLPSLWWMKRNDANKILRQVWQVWALLLLGVSLVFEISRVLPQAGPELMAALWAAALAILCVLLEPTDRGRFSLFPWISTHFRHLLDRGFDGKVLEVTAQIGIYVAAAVSLRALSGLVTINLGSGLALVLMFGIHAIGLWITNSSDFRLSTLILLNIFPIWLLRLVTGSYVLILEWPLASLVCLAYAEIVNGAAGRTFLKIYPDQYAKTLIWINRCLAACLALGVLLHFTEAFTGVLASLCGALILGFIVFRTGWTLAAVASLFLVTVAAHGLYLDGASALGYKFLWLRPNLLGVWFSWPGLAYLQLGLCALYKAGASALNRSPAIDSESEGQTETQSSPDVAGAVFGLQIFSSPAVSQVWIRVLQWAHPLLIGLTIISGSLTLVENLSHGPGVSQGLAILSLAILCLPLRFLVSGRALAFGFEALTSLAVYWCLFAVMDYRVNVFDDFGSWMKLVVTFQLASVALGFGWLLGARALDGGISSCQGADAEKTQGETAGAAGETRPRTAYWRPDSGCMDDAGRLALLLAAIMGLFLVPSSLLTTMTEALGGNVIALLVTLTTLAFHRNGLRGRGFLGLLFLVQMAVCYWTTTFLILSFFPSEETLWSIPILAAGFLGLCGLFKLTNRCLWPGLVDSSRIETAAQWSQQLSQVLSPLVLLWATDFGIDVTLSVFVSLLVVFVASFGAGGWVGRRIWPGLALIWMAHAAPSLFAEYLDIEIRLIPACAAFIALILAGIRFFSREIWRRSRELSGIGSYLEARIDSSVIQWYGHLIGGVSFGLALVPLLFLNQAGYPTGLGLTMSVVVQAMLLGDRRNARRGVLATTLALAMFHLILAFLGLSEGIQITDLARAGLGAILAAMILEVARLVLARWKEEELESMVSVVGSITALGAIVLVGAYVALQTKGTQRADTLIGALDLFLVSVYYLWRGFKDRQEWAVWVGELCFALFYAYLRITGLKDPGQYTPIVGVGLSFLFYSLARLAAKHNVTPFERPLRYSSLVLPLAFVVLSLAKDPSAGPNSTSIIAMMLSGLFYTTASLDGNWKNLKYLAALLYNGGLFLTWYRVNPAEPQGYLTCLAVTILWIVQTNRDIFSRRIQQNLRLLAVLLLIASPVLSYLQGGKEVMQLVYIGGMSLVLATCGVIFRIRIFLYSGSLVFVLDLATFVLNRSLANHTFGTLVLLAAGASIVSLAAVFEKKQATIRKRFEQIQEELENWD